MTSHLEVNQARKTGIAAKQGATSTAWPYKAIQPIAHRLRSRGG